MKVFSDHRTLAADMFYAALRAVDPYGTMKEHARRVRSVFEGGKYRRLLVTGFGKAACPMARAVEEELADLITTGVVITKYGHREGKKLRQVSVREAGHPVPDESGLKATEQIATLLKESAEDTLVVCLISGGGSALLVSPYEGITLGEKRATTELLLRAGADIYETNTVRKHISKVKGGRLAQMAHPAGMFSLILSDVIGDRLDVIASGPTSPDGTTYRDSLDVLDGLGLTDQAPRSVMEVLNKGAQGLLPETPKEGNMIFERVENIVIGNNKNALDAAGVKAESLGFDVEIITSELTGEARDAGRSLAKKARETGRIQNARPRCLLSGGETTVRVKGRGLGGRNMELALAFAAEIEGLDGITLLSAGTDGTDGPTDAAGAVVDGQTVRRAEEIGLDPKAYLTNNDSYNFFRKLGGLFVTGPTGTNVMDLQIILLA